MFLYQRIVSLNLMQCCNNYSVEIPVVLKNNSDLIRLNLCQDNGIVASTKSVTRASDSGRIATHRCLSKASKPLFINKGLLHPDRSFSGCFST